MMIFYCINCNGINTVNTGRDLGACSINDDIPYMYKLCLDGTVFYCKLCNTYNRIIYNMKEDLLTVIKIGGE